MVKCNQLLQQVLEVFFCNVAGVSNDFLVNSAAQTALEYNDIHVNENMHAALAFKIFLKPANNFLIEKSDPELYRYFRQTVISIVLATDMAGHEELMHVKPSFTPS